MHPKAVRRVINRRRLVTVHAPENVMIVSHNGSSTWKRLADDADTRKGGQDDA